MSRSAKTNGLAIGTEALMVADMTELFSRQTSV
jgi:hypothetical protein